MKFRWLLFAGVLGFSSCQREAFSWDVDNTIPLFNTEFKLDDIDPRYMTNVSGDSSYTLSYENLVYSYKVNDVQVTDTGIDASFNLRKLKLNDQQIQNEVTLGDINPIFKLLNGQQTAIPAQDQTDLDPTDIDASAFFETATLDTGYLDISIQNDLPVDISLIVFELRNKEDNTVVATDSFKNIAASGGVSKQTIDLGGKTVTKSLVGVIRKLVTKASNGPVLIESDKGIKVILGVRNLRPVYAIAAFPTQDVINQDEGLILYMGGADIKYFKVESGRLRIKVVSTIQEDMSMVLALPGATKDGKSFYQEVSLPGPGGKGVATTERIYEMAGYLLDFRGKDPDIKDTVNTFHQILKVTLDSSGRKLAVGLQDSIVLEYRLEGLKPEYAIGYLGNQLSRTGLDTTGFDLFKGLSGDVKFKDIKLGFVLRNSIGADGRFRLHQLAGINQFSGKDLALSANPLNNDLFVSKPKFIRGDFTETKVELDVNNSNVKPFLENLPQILEYDLETEVSPNGNVNNYTDFVFDESKLDVIMRLDVPISFEFGGLVFRDTQGVNFANITNVDRLKSATLFMDMDNGFPIDLDLKIELMDENRKIIGALELEPGGRIAANSPTDFAIKLPRDQMDALRRTQYFHIVAKAATGPGLQKIYNTSRLKIHSRMRFEYEIQN
jgi:hypothetical protein